MAVTSAMRCDLVDRLARAGCVAAAEETDELIEAAGGDGKLLDALVSRRLTGEPLGWVIGSVTFVGHRVRVDRGVYVPRWQSEPLARRAVDLLPRRGLAADLCTGSGAIAVALARGRERARIVASELDPVAYRCAVANGVEVYRGHLADPLPAELRGHFDVVIAVVPYVPSDELEFLPRDVREHEPLLALDGGLGGMSLLSQAVPAGAELLHAGGTLLLELGGDQAGLLAPVLAANGFAEPRLLEDGDGELRGIEARLLRLPG